jgi:alkylhydroperoxidase/carboxymuconolactone decarboxylase family protein YurZ
VSAGDGESLRDLVLDRMRDRRGYALPLHEYMADLDAGFLDLFDESFCHTLGVSQEGGGALAVEYRELICACVAAVNGATTGTLKLHLARAFEHGLTEAQAAAGFQAMFLPGGGLATARGYQALMEMRDSQGE